MIIFNDSCYLLETELSSDTGDFEPKYEVDPDTGDMVLIENKPIAVEKLTKCRTARSYKLINTSKGDIVPSQLKISLPKDSVVNEYTRIKLLNGNIHTPIRIDYINNILGVVEYVAVYV